MTAEAALAAPNGGSVRVAQIRGLITQRDEDPSHIKEPADQAPTRSSGLGYKLAPNIPVCADGLPTPPRRRPRSTAVWCYDRAPVPALIVRRDLAFTRQRPGRR